jgi:hypothetical protein
VAEIISLYIVCRNIGMVARSRGVRARPYQVKAVILWILFEFIGAFLAAAVGIRGFGIYLAAFVGAVLSLPVSFNLVRAAIPKRKVVTVPKPN